MNVVARPSSSTTSVKHEGKQSYSATVNFYNEPPSLELSLDDFEEYALTRLKVSEF